MVINAKQLPQLLTYEDETAKAILRNLKKVKIKNEYQLVDLGVNEYVSIPKLDQKAFRYIEKNGKLYLRESVYSVGGLVQDSVLINLGDFTLGDDETGAGLEYLARVKDAKAKQRAQQLRECERIAMQTLNKINQQVKNAELIQKWQDELKENQRFVRLGKEDYYQSQVAIIAKYAPADETLAKILVDYDTKINAKNEKWLTQPLKLPKVKNPAERIGTAERAGIGTLDPQRRAEFEQYYAVRSPQMSPYLNQDQEIAAELPAAPTIVTTKDAQATTDRTATAQTNKLKANKMAAVQQLKNVFQTKTAAPTKLTTVTTGTTTTQATQTTNDAELSR